ncbi:MAG: GNAT family N-acetyltransferase, partial [Brevibacterium aurantiacum]|nr:GNAT family N-acetyltransferase [Brevibacterium aurantiacum]
IIGIGRYDRVNDTDAEVAFNISDDHQGRGLGSVLLEHLAAAARERRIDRFVAEVLPQNRKMLGVFKDAGYEVAHHFEDGVVEMEFSIDPTEKSLAVMQAREHRAEANSLAGLLRAESVAVVGAGGSDRSFGSILLRNLLQGDFTGTIHVVHPTLEEIQGIRTVRRLTDIEGGVNLVLMAIPAQAVMDSLLEGAQAKVWGIVVYANGFAESGEDGQELQKVLATRARGLGMRVVGPSTFGIVNNAPEYRLNATPAPELPQSGHLGLYSQSAALGIAMLATAERRGLAVSSFVSVGNRADVSGNDVMQFWTEDEDTHVVAMYLESTGNPRKFSRIARTLAYSKPTIVVKTGKNRVPGHIVRESRVPMEVWNAMLSQAGVIQVENIHQMFDVAQLLTSMPVPRGNRVGIVANSEALAGIALEAAEGWGLTADVPPISVTPESPVEQFHAALETMMSSPDVDSVVVSFVPRISSDGLELVDAVSKFAHGSDKPIAACFVGIPESHQGLGSDTQIPAYPTPTDAVRAVAAACQYGRRLREEKGHLGEELATTRTEL